MNIPKTTINRWEETEKLLKVFGSRSKPAPDQILRLGELYTELIADLNHLNRQIDDPEARRRANDLAFRVYTILYPKKSFSFTDLLWFFFIGFPGLIRQRLHFIIISAMIFATASLIGYICIHEKSRLIDLVVSPVEQQRLKNMALSIRPNDPLPKPRETSFGLSSSIMVNNIRVSIKGFAIGIFFAVGTIGILIINGLNLGALAAIYTEAGFSGYFWSLILPHGGLELACIFICSGAGLILGYSLINPGPYFRKDWIIKEGHDAVRLLAGSIPLLILAALIEAYITPANFSVEVKLLISAVFFLLLLAWLIAGAYLAQRRELCLTRK